MKIVVANLNEISKNSLLIDDYKNRLSENDRQRFDRIRDKNRQLQFLVGRMMIYENVGQEFYLNEKGKPCSDHMFFSLAHSGEAVVLAIDTQTIGVDVENIRVKRDFSKLAMFMKFKSGSPLDFYKQFTAYEADYKAGEVSRLNHHYYIWNDFLICVSTKNTDKMLIYQTIPFNHRESVAFTRLTDDEEGDQVSKA